MRLRPILIPLLLLVTGALSAGEPAGPHPVEAKIADCHRQALSTVEMLDCAERERQAWDTELNRVYKRLMALLTPEAKGALRAAQRKWIEQRDLEYTAIGTLYTQPGFEGTMWGPIRAGLANRILRDRVLQLQGYLDDMEMNRAEQGEPGR